MRTAFALLLIVLAALSSAIGAPIAPGLQGDIPLEVDFGEANPEVPYPVRGGVPFARGELKDLKSLQLVQAGKQVDCQFGQLAVWPDGSLKWVKLDLLARPSERFVLRRGRNVTRTAVDRAVSIAEAEDGSITVDTGMLRAVIRKDGGGFLDEVAFGGSVIVKPGDDRRSFVDFIHVADPKTYETMHRVIDGTLDPSQLVIEELRVEEGGPVHAVVLVRGHYQYKLVGSTYPDEVKLRGRCPFTLRLHFYRGSGMVQVEHFFVYEGQPDNDLIRQIGLSLPVALPRGGTSVTYGGDQDDHQSEAGLSSLFQESSDSYRVMEASAEGRYLETTDMGSRAPGWMDVSTGQIGVAAGVRWFWQQHAKSLTVDISEGRLGVHLWPPQARPLEYRRYAKTQCAGEAGIGIAKGTGKVHEMMLYFHGPELSRDEIAQQFRAFEARPLLVAPAERYARTQVLGRYHPRTKGAFEDVEAAIQQPIDYWAFCQERFRWYGFFDYGDVQSCYNSHNKQNRWDSDYGRWGWAGGDQQGRLNFALFLQYLRTGTRRNFELAEANVRHVHTVDAVHTTEYQWRGEWQNLKGGVHRHNAQHWAGGYTPARGAHPVGAKIYYYLTGSEWARDTLDEVLEMSILGNNSELAGPAMQSYICAWERTGDPKYKELLLEQLEKAGFAGRTSGWTTMMAAAFGMYDAMIEYMELTGDKRFVETVNAFAKNSADPQVLRSWVWPGGYFRIYGEALRVTGDRRWQKILDDALKKWLSQMGRCGSALPRDEWPGRVESTFGLIKAGATPGFSTDANTLRDLPFALDAMPAAEGANK